MLKRFAIAILSGIAILLIGFAVNKGIEQKAGDEMYIKFCSALSDYPNLPAPFVSSFCQLEIDGIKYLMIQDEGKYITAMRLENGETTYCHNDRAYHIVDDKVLELESDIPDVPNMIRTNLSSLLQDATVTYHYLRPSGRDLPLWIYPYDPPYLLITHREKYADYTETMIYSDAEQFEIRWCITQSSSDEDVVLFLGAFDDGLNSSNLRFVHGWGSLPESIFTLLDSQQ